MGLEIPIKLLVDPKSGRSAQAEFINSIKRHVCFSGGYGNGKSYAASIKGLIRLGTFPRYRIAICRYSVTDLKRSTMSTFYKICPPELYSPSNGGNRADSLNYLKLINGSEVFWMHLDDADEKTVRGLEVNSVIIDQAEEVSENMYNHLSARVGRWEMAEVPPELLFQHPNWPRNPETNRHVVPNQMMILCNPDSELHWIYKRYHPESLEWLETYRDSYDMVQASSTENPTLDPETLKDMMANDPVWVQRFVFGKWGIPGGAIHEVHPSSVLELGIETNLELGRYGVSFDFVENLRKSARLYRILDHADTGPTCCLWAAAYKDWFFFFREYYKSGMLISDHRKEIDSLSRFEDGTPEHYSANWSDPQMFKRESQKFGGYWSDAEEYSDPRVEGPPIFWEPADNNERATRNRINEYLKISDHVPHPVTGQMGAPRVYFIKRAPNGVDSKNLGVYHAILETKAQKRMQIDTINGKPIFSEDRDESVPDHAYDCARYFVAMHPFYSKSTSIRTPSGSFSDLRSKMKALRQNGDVERIFGDRPASLGRY